MSHENSPPSRPTPTGHPSDSGTAPPYDVRPGPEKEAPATHRPQLSLTQIVGGALAAMTAAALGSRLGVGGTIIGAAVASVVAAVGGALYTASLRTTRAKVRATLWAGRPHRGTRVSVEAVPPGPETWASDVQPAAAVAPADAVADLPTVVGGPVPTGIGAPAHPGASKTRDETLTPAARARQPLPWKRIVGGAVAAFGLAAVALTGVELVTGTAISGGDGTTFSQVSGERPNRSRPAPAESTASPSEQESGQSSDDSSTDSSAEPSASSTPSASASESTSESSTEPSATPGADTTSAPAPDPTTADPTTADPTTAPTTEPSAEPSAGSSSSSGAGSAEGSGDTGTQESGSTGGGSGTS